MKMELVGKVLKGDGMSVGQMQSERDELRVLAKDLFDQMKKDGRGLTHGSPVCSCPWCNLYNRAEKALKPPCPPSK